MKKITYIILALIISTALFSAEIPLTHIPQNYQSIVHVNVAKITRSVNVENFEKAVLKTIGLLLSGSEQREAIKFLKETLPALKEAGFNIYRDIHQIVIGIKNINRGNKVVINFLGNFNEEAIKEKLFSLLTVSKNDNIQNYEVYSNPFKDLHLSYVSNKLVIAASSSREIVKALKAGETNRNILNNPKFASIYNKSIKNKAINVISVFSFAPPAYRRPHRRPRYRNQSYQETQGFGGGGMTAMFMKNLNGFNMSVDIPDRLGIYIKVFTKDPNVAATIGMFAQQQLPMVPGLVQQQLVKTNKRIKRLLKRISRSRKLYLKRRLFAERFKKFFLLLARYAGNKLRIVTVGKTIKLNFVWSRRIVQTYLKQSGLPFDLNKLLR